MTDLRHGGHSLDDFVGEDMNLNAAPSLNALYKIAEVIKPQVQAFVVYSESKHHATFVPFANLYLTASSVELGAKPALRQGFAVQIELKLQNSKLFQQRISKSKSTSSTKLH